MSVPENPGPRNNLPPAWPPPPGPPGAAWPPPPTAHYAPRPFGPIYLSAVPAMRWAIGFLVATIVLDLITAGSEIVQARNYYDFLVTMTTSGLDLLQFVVSIPTAVFFLIWVYRVCSNAYVFAPQHLTITPGWTVGYFFVPILNFFRPFQAMQDAWRASEPGLDLRADPGGWTRVAGGAVVGWWWAVWLFHNLASLAYAAASFDNGEVYRRAGVPAMLDLMDVANTAVAIWFVLSLTRRQEEAARRLTSSAGGR